MGTLKDRIKKRNKIALDETNKILDDYSIIFDDVFTSISRGSMSAKWISIDFHRHTNKLLDVVGIAGYNVGETITNDFDEVIYIDATNSDNYKKAMRVILPVHLVENADIDGLDLFVREYSELIMASSQDELDLMVADNEFLNEAFTCFGTDEAEKLKKVKTPLYYDGFDLSDFDLDDEQVKQLLMLKPEGQA